MLPRFSTIERDGYSPSRDVPDPARAAREALSPGDAVQLLFDIETREGGRVVDRGVDRLWVIVKRRVDDQYYGVLDSDPRRADRLSLRPGVEVIFAPEHVIAIERPPEGYAQATYGADFFDT